MLLQAISPILDRQTNAFELLNKCYNLLEYDLLLGQVQWIERAHFRQQGVELRAVFAGKFALDRRGKIPTGRLGVEVLLRDQFLGLLLLDAPGVHIKGFDHTVLVAQVVEVGLVDEVDHQALFCAVAETGS